MTKRKGLVKMFYKFWLSHTISPRLLARSGRWQSCRYWSEPGKRFHWWNVKVTGPFEFAEARIMLSESVFLNVMCTYDKKALITGKLIAEEKTTGHTLNKNHLKCSCNHQQRSISHSGLVPSSWVLISPSLSSSIYISSAALSVCIY
jgi:hypothetical protein